jgi:hypothetical protein
MKPLHFLSLVTISFSLHAQGTTDGNLILQNINIAVSPGATTGGSNNNGTYNVPIYGPNQIGLGLAPGGAKAALFLTSDLNTPLATTILGTAPGSAPFFATPFSQPVTIPGNAPGTTPSLTIRVWQDTTKTFAQAQAAGLPTGSWTFPAPPLGGTPSGGTPIQTPTLTGWGNINGSGFTLPEPSAIALAAFGFGALLIRHRK